MNKPEISLTDFSMSHRHLTRHLRSHLIAMSSKHCFTAQPFRSLGLWKQPKAPTTPVHWYTAQLLITLHYYTQNVCAKSKPFREQFVCFASRIHVRDRFLTSILLRRHSWLPTRLWSHQIFTKFDRSYTNARSRLFTVQHFQHTVCSVRYNLTTSIYFKELLEEKKNKQLTHRGATHTPL